MAPPPGLIAWWPGEGNANDIVGTNNGILKGGVMFAPGEVGQALSFDGVSGYVTNDVPGLTNIRNSYTMEFWAWPTAARASSAESTSGLTGTSGQRYAIFPDNYGAAGYAGAGVSVGTNGVSVFEHSLAYLPSLLVYDAPIIGWTHIAVVHQNRQATLYVNGVLVRTGLVSGTDSYPSTSLGEGSSGLGLYYGYYAGLLDEVSIYDRALTSSEVQAIYNAGSAGKCRPQETNGCVTPPAGLIAWWPGEGNANDIVGTYNGILEGGVTFAPGKVGQALSFDGVSGYVTNTVPGLTNIRNSYTMEFWAWPTAARASSSESTSGLTGTSGQRYAIFPDNYGAPGYAGAGVSVGTNGVSVFEHSWAYLPSLLVYDAPIIGWTHIAVVHSNRQATLYINGVLVRTGLVSGTDSFPSTGLGEGDSGPALYYGYYAGLLDEVSIYSRALTASEVQAIYNAGSAGKCRPSGTNGCVPPPSGLISWWPGEGNANDVMSANNGTLPGGVGFADGEVGRAFDFNGLSQYVDVGNPSNLTPAASFSIEGWVYPRQDGGQVIMSKWADSPAHPNQRSYVFQTLPGQELCFGISDWSHQLDAAFHAFTTTNHVFGLNAWSHVAAVYDQAAGARRIYVNGAKVAERIDAPLTVADGTAEVILGAALSYGPADAFFDGLIDELSFYSGALSDSQIQAIYNAGSAGKCHAPVAPSIQTPPQSQTVVVGADASFSVVAGGTGPLSYQWRFNGSDIAGATGSALALRSVQITNAGTYEVTVSNLYGSANSPGAVLTVLTPPQITLQPQDQTVVVGSDATFSVAATGSGPLSYQWYVDGAAVGGATNSSLMLSGVSLSQAASYQVSVSNLVGAVWSRSAVLVVLETGPCTAPPAGLVSWWPGEGNANDIADTNNGILQGGVTFAPGEVGQAFSFDGVSGYVTNTAPGLQNIRNSYTMEFWAWPTAGRVSSSESTSGLTGTSGQRYAIFPDNYGAPGYAGAGVSVGTNGVSFFEHSLAYLPSLLVYDAPIIGWTHIAVVHTNRQATLYINGVPVRTGLVSGTDSYPSTSLGEGSSGQALYYGHYAGLLDEVSIYSRALTSSEVQAIYNAGSAGKCRPQGTNECVTPPSGLIGWWPGEGNGYDIVGGNSGVLKGGVAFAPGEVGQAFSFDGVSGYVTNAMPGLQNIRNSYTMEFWAWPTAGRVSTAESTSGLAGTSGQRYAIFPDNYGAPGYAGAGVSVGTNGVSFFEHSLAYLPSLLVYDAPIIGWTHVAVVHTNRQATLYINGVLVRTGLVSGTDSFPSTSLGEGDSGPALYYGYYAGLLDEVSIYSRALSASEIAAIYAAGASGKCRTLSAPYIYAQPANQVAAVGSSVTFNVGVAGTPPLSYQWSFGGSPLNGATDASLTLTNVQISQAGNYSVVVTNVAGTASSSNATLSVNFPLASVRVVNVTNAHSGNTVSVPVSLAASGNESGLGFSLNFDTNKLTYVSAALGSGAGGATLLTNATQAASGKLGMILALPAGQTFAPGKEEVVEVTFMSAVRTIGFSTTVSFGDVPIVRQLSDVSGNALAATYASGVVTVQAADFEGDVSPRPNGDKAVTVTDWVLEGRYVAGLDSPTNAAEFQRADCAPSATLGDGKITVIDWVQVGLYAAGLDPLTVAGGPTNEVPPGGRSVAKLGLTPISPHDVTCKLEVPDTMVVQGMTGTASVELDSLGDENALGFSLVFDPSALNYVSAGLGSAGNGATLFVNDSQAGAGRLGFVLGLGTGQTFASGARELVKVTFRAAAGAKGTYPVSFAAQPVVCEVSDTNALRLAVGYVNGTVTVNPLPTLSIGRSGEDITLAWPLWATNFGLQAAAGGLSPSVPWTNLVVAPTLTSNQVIVTLPLASTNVFYRLHQQ